MRLWTGGGWSLGFGASLELGAWSLALLRISFGFSHSEFGFHCAPPVVVVWLVRDCETSGTIISNGCWFRLSIPGSAASWIRTRTADGKLVLPRLVSQDSRQSEPS